MSNQIFMFDDLVISIDLGINLSTAIGVKVLYKKPSGTPGEWEANVSGTKVLYSATNGEIDEPGWWQFEARADVDGKKSSGISTQYVDKPLDV